MLLDTEVLEQLARNTSAKAFPVMLEMFVRELEQRVDTVERLLAEDALRAAGEEAHTIKALAGTFGALQLQALAFELERAGRGNHCNRMDDIGGRFFECAGRTLECYRARLDCG